MSQNLQCVWDFHLVPANFRILASSIFIQARNQISFGLTNIFLTATACQLIYYATTPTECNRDWRSLYGNNLPMLKVECDITNLIL